jgi:hypothetical protein
MNILVFVVLVILSSIGSHLLLKSYVAAALLASFVAAICFQLFAYVAQGYLDPLFVVAFIVSWLVSLIAALVIGIPFFLERKKFRKT